MDANWLTRLVFGQARESSQKVECLTVRPPLELPAKEERITCRWSDDEGRYLYILEKVFVELSIERGEVIWLFEAPGDRAKADRWAAHYDIPIPDVPEK